MGNKWKEEYIGEMEKIRFSEKEKERLITGVMSTSQVSRSSGKRVWSSISRRGVAAACLAGGILLAGVAGASAAGLLKPVADVFTEVFGLTDNNREVAEEMGVSLGTSAVSHGIRVTADAVLTDPHSYAIVFSVERENGKPLLPEDGNASQSDTWDFKEFEEENFSDHDEEFTWGSFHSYDEDPEDASIQYVVMMTYSGRQEGKDGFTVCLRDLCHYTGNYTGKDWEVRGKWKLHIPYESSVDSAVTLAQGESLTIGDSDMTIENITLSPMTGHISVWAPRNAQRDAVDSLKPLLRSQIELELKNGKKIRLENQGVIDTSDGVRCTFAACFDTLIPLSDMKLIRINDVEWPVPSKGSDGTTASDELQK